MHYTNTLLPSTHTRATDYVSLTKCLCCDQQTLVELLDLNRQPLANSYHTNTASLPTYPLALNLCTECFHAQQVVAVNPDLMFKDYAYLSGVSKTMLEYFDWFARMTEERFGRHLIDKSVLDIACNDGSQLAAFKKYGWQLFGVDPAENLLARSRAIGAEVVCDYFTAESAQKFGRKFDIVTAQNVFAHTADPYGFLLAAKQLMHPGSKLIIQTSQADMIDHGEFDTIYHEHISFFSARSMMALARRAGLALEDIMMVPVHGSSYVFVLGFGGEARDHERLAHEEAIGRYNPETHRRFAAQAHAAVRTLKEKITPYAERGYALVGFGAAAKGNTFLNFGGITLEYIIDDTPLKQGLHTPGMNIKIEPAERLIKEERPAAIVVLPWNFFDEIYKRCKTLRPGKDDVFLRYFPQVTEHR